MARMGEGGITCIKRMGTNKTNGEGEGAQNNMYGTNGTRMRRGKE
jgi:hypothetical protein